MSVPSVPVFEWSEPTALENLRKHGVTFDEAGTAFSDANALIIEDDDHSENEERFVLLDMSAAARVLVVCHCVRMEGATIRIISARRATRSERVQYARRDRP